MNTNNLDETTVMFANMDKKLKIIVDTAVGFNDYDTGSSNLLESTD